MFGDIVGILMVAVLVAMAVMGLAMMADGQWQRVLVTVLEWRDRRKGAHVETATPTLEHSTK